MSYRCSVCEIPVPPKTPKIRHTVYRDTPDGRQIAREVDVCRECSDKIRLGIPLLGVEPPPPDPSEDLVAPRF